jgi:hypothetical protein
MATFQIRDKETGEVFTIREKGADATPPTDNSEGMVSRGLGMVGDIAGNISKAGVAAAIPIAIGAGAKNVYDTWKTGDSAKLELKNQLGKKYGLEKGSSPEYVRKLIQDKIQLARVENSRSVELTKNVISNEQAMLGKKVGSINLSHIPKRSSDLANTIKSGVQGVYKTVSDRYGATIDAADTLAQESGFEPTNKQFASNVLNRVIDEAETSGISEKEIAQVTRVRDSLLDKSPIVSRSGAPIETGIKLSDAKAIISNLTKDRPYSPLSAKLREAWSSFLENEAPENIKPIYRDINTKYKSFSELRNFLNQVSTPKKGEYDTRNLAKVIEDYVKKEGDTGLSKVMQVLGEGNDLVPAIPGVKEKFAKISALKSGREAIIRKKMAIDSSRAGIIASKKISGLNKVEELLRDRTRAGQLVDVAESSSAKLNPLKAAGKMILKGGRLIPGVATGVIENELMRRSVGYDPAEAFDLWYRMTFGSPEERKAIEDAVIAELMKRSET